MKPSSNPARDERAARVTDSVPILRLRDVRFSWSATTPPVIDITRLDVTRGEHVFITGPSGSGKSTLLNLLGGVVVPQSGEVEVLDQIVGDMPGWRRDRFRADHIGFVFQMFNLIPYLSMIDNVTLPCRFSRRRHQRAVERSGSLRAEAERLLMHLELDSPQLLERNVTELSIGQQQRVAAARALIGTPELMIADEPTSALDDTTRESFLNLLFAESRSAGTTLLFVSHDQRLRQHFDRNIRLADVNQSTIESQ